jgi:hypothetical protein
MKRLNFPFLHRAWFSTLRLRFSKRVSLFRSPPPLGKQPLRYGRRRLPLLCGPLADRLAIENTAFKIDKERLTSA